MKKILFILFLMTYCSGMCQDKIAFTAKINNIYFKNFNYYGDYGLTAINLGINVKMKSGNSLFYVAYGVLYNYPVPKEWVRGYDIISHDIGLSMEYHFTEEEKRFRPFIEIDIFSEIKSNYKNGILDNESLTSPIIRELSAETMPTSSLSTPGKVVFKNSFYYSTPFIGSILAGCAIRLVDNLHLSLAVGYGRKMMKYKYLEWQKGDDYQSMLEKRGTKTKNFNYVDFQLGLSYTFSFHKNRKK